MLKIFDEATEIVFCPLVRGKPFLDLSILCADPQRSYQYRYRTLSPQALESSRKNCNQEFFSKAQIGIKNGNNNLIIHF